jgi:hypothetical protein
MIVAQVGNFTFIVTQTPHKVEVKQVDEKKEGEGESKAKE